MKMFGLEVIESDAVPPGVMLVVNKAEYERLMAQVQEMIIKQLWETGLFVSVGRLDPDDAGLRVIEDGAYQINSL